ncbi:MAG: class I SAM-dependent methyltransferase [Candidatus Magasanikbacteria bacterium]
MDSTGIIQKKMMEYYSHYYRDICSLRDWRQRAEQRLHEEEREKMELREREKILSMKFTEHQKHFVFGAGTGGLVVALQQNYSCEVFGIEPSEAEFEIIQEKCKRHNIPLENFRKEFGENISFDSNQFDVVHCYTVLEHVDDVERCMDEMIRIVKPGGLIYMNTPNYRFPYERHYKIVFPTFLPKIFGRLYLFLMRRRTSFLSTINFVTEKSINKILVRKKNIVWYRLYRPFNNPKSRLNFLYNFLLFKLFVYPNQEIIISKQFE